MITQDFLDSLGLPPDKAKTLQDALQKDAVYRGILYKIGVFPGAVEAIMRSVDACTIDISNKELLTEKCRVEWQEYVRKGNVQ